MKNEDTRTHGTALHTALSRLPERFSYGPHTETMGRYLGRRWKAASYGWFRRISATTYNPEWEPEWSKRDRYRWVESPSESLRFVGKAHEIRGSGNGNVPYFDYSLIGHNGWYTDNHHDETVWGEVYQLPSRAGKSQYVPAVSDPNNDGAILDFHDATDDLKEAIRSADSMAESYADAEREYQAKQDQTDRLEEITGEIAETYAAFKRLARETRANCERLEGLTELKALLHQEYRRVKARVRKLRTEHRKIEENGISYGF